MYDDACVTAKGYSVINAESKIYIEKEIDRRPV
jgi:hypothetical protein